MVMFYVDYVWFWIFAVYYCLVLRVLFVMVGFVYLCCIACTIC